MDCSPPGSSVQGDSPGKNAGVGAMPSSRRSSQPRDQMRVSYVSCIGKWVLYHWCHLGSPRFIIEISICKGVLLFASGRERTIKSRNLSMEKAWTEICMTTTALVTVLCLIISPTIRSPLPMSSCVFNGCGWLGSFQGFNSVFLGRGNVVRRHTHY